MEIRMRDLGETGTQQGGGRRRPALEGDPDL